MMLDTQATVSGLRDQVAQLVIDRDALKSKLLSMSHLSETTVIQREIDALDSAIEKKEILIRDYLAVPGSRPSGLDIVGR